jgi:hypothetical protein
MGHREVKRVPLDFDWPRGEVWGGYLMPDKLGEEPCGACCYDRAPSSMDRLFPQPRSGNGYSPHGNYLHDLWYGYVPFDPAGYGSARLTPDTPAVRAFAERNVSRDPGFYGAISRADALRNIAHHKHAQGRIAQAELEGRLTRIAFIEQQDGPAAQIEAAIVREATRLADMWNGQWCHHLNQDDVNALVEAGRLRDFTHTWSRENGWQEKEPPFIPTAAQVNEWSLRGMGHDSINAGICVRARCEREGFEVECPACHGHGSTERYPGQRAEAEAWEPVEPPAGDGWQLWETTSEGSPSSPVFATAEELAAWCEGNATAFADIHWTRNEWLRSFLGGETSADTLLISDSSGVHTLGPVTVTPSAGKD